MSLHRLWLLKVSLAMSLGGGLIWLITGWIQALVPYGQLQ